MYGGQRAVRELGLPAAPSPKHEYGTTALTLELVDSMEEAIDHIHKNGSSHTESIVSSARPAPSRPAPHPHPCAQTPVARLDILSPQSAHAQRTIWCLR